MIMSVILYVAVIAVGAWLLYSKRAPSPPKLNLPYLKFEGDNSASRYLTESGSILGRGYSQYLKKGSPFCMRDPNDSKRPMVMLPVKYIEEVKWIPENRMSFWKQVDKQGILPQIGGPSITEEVVHAAKKGLNRALGHLIEPLRQACLATYAKEMPPCPEWSSLLPYPIIVKIFTGMSACALVGPELGDLDSEWQSLSIDYVTAVVTAPSIVKEKYPSWLYWLSQYTNDGIKTMWKHRARACEILAPVLQSRIDATEELRAKGAKERRGPRKYEDAVQWLLDAHTAHEKTLTPDQLTQNLLALMAASVHSTSSTGLTILFDMLEHPDTLLGITQEILQTQSKLQGGLWTREALGDLRLLDSFMRESVRVHALTQYTSTQRIPTAPWKFKDGLEIPAGFTMAFPSYHHSFDPAIHPQPDTFDARRHLRKRQESNMHKFHFASVSEDMLNWGAGRHACPGRFFAQEMLKLWIIHLLTHYEFKHVAGTEEAPRYLPSHLFLVPNQGLPILFKEREVSL